jgi:hypothetical protein
MLMAKTKSPKTNGVKDAVPAVNQQPVEQHAVSGAQTSEAPSVSAVKSEGTTTAEARKPRAAKSTAPKLEAVRTEPRGTVVPINLDDEIRRLAYLLSERRGFAPGHENEDWLAAEHEVLQRYRQHSAQSA